MDILGVAAVALLLWIGRTQIKTGAMTPGVFIAFIIAVFRLYDPVRKMAFFNNSFQQAVGASRKFSASWTKRTKSGNVRQPLTLPAFRDRVRFENVSFSYSGAHGASLRSCAM